MGKRNIWPANGGDALIEVDDTTYDIAKAEIEKITASNTGADTVWEVIRKVLASERAAQAKRERRARGDFGVELTEASGLASDIAYRTDGETYESVSQLIEKLDEMRNARGFDTSDVDALTGLHQELVDNLHQTDEIAVQLQRIILSLNGDDD